MCDFYFENYKFIQMDIFVTGGTQLILIILNDKVYFFLIYSAVNLLATIPSLLNKKGTDPQGPVPYI